MKIGHSRRCLTPQNNFYLIGYGSKNRQHYARGIHDDIYCNCLLFDDSETELFMFSADFIEFEEEMVEEVKTMMSDLFGLNRDLVLLCATHDHSSVRDYHKDWHSGEFNEEYYRFVFDVIAQCYKEAKMNKVEATAKIGRYISKGFYGNRNHPGVLADNEIIITKFFDDKGNEFAGLINWAVHSTVIGPENDLLTADLAGNVSSLLKEKWGYYPAMIVGAAGDCSNRNERQGNGFEELDRVSRGLADQIEKVEVNQDIELGKIRYQTLFHTIHHDMKKIHEEVRVAQELYKEKYEKEENFDKKKIMKSILSHFENDLKINSFHLDAKGWVIKMGDLNLVVFPGELGSDFGIQLKNSIKNALIVGYTNGFYHYFMPEKEYGVSHETIGSPITRGEPEKMIEKFILAANRIQEG